MYRKLLVCFVWLIGSGFYALNDRKPTVFLVGDSTVSTFAARYAPMTGWGHEFHEFFTDDVTVDNRAIAGKSSRSFIEEGKWARVLRDIQPGDYLFIQFGHNDQKQDHRYTIPYTTYQDFLTQYVQETRHRGGIPILVTSVMRRRFRHGKMYDTHGNYPPAVRALADELEVPLIDLHQRSFTHFDQLGEEATKDIFLWLKPGEEKNYSRGLEDNTHFSRYGAREVGKLVIAGLKTLDLPLKNYLKDYQPPCQKEVAETVTICRGERATIGGQDRTEPGIYRVDAGKQDGCHITRVVTLVVNQPSASSRTITLCEGESRMLGGKTRRTSGTYYDTFSNRLGCDSVVTTRLIVNPTHETRRTRTVCQGDSVRIDGRYRSEAGEYRHVYRSRQGCDSTVITQLVVRPVVERRITRSLCPGDSLRVGNRYISEAGRYRQTYQTRSGCDSTIIVTLNVIPIRRHQRSLVIAEGDSIRLGGHYRRRAGTYRDTLRSSLGCDSVITTALRVIPSPTATQQTLTLCAGDSALVGGAYQQQRGVFYDTLVHASGAQDIITTTLNVLPHYRQERTVTVCAGEGVTLRGTFRTQPGVYYDTLTASSGCDSVLVTTLRVAASVPPPAVVATSDTLRSSVEGDRYRWFLNGEEWGDATSAIVPSQEGHYAVAVTVGTCESSRSEVYHYVPVVTSTSEARPTAPLRAYRAEGGSFLNLTVPTTPGPSATVYVHNLLGHCVYQGKVRTSLHRIPFHQPQGIYVVTLTEAGRRQSVKVYW